MLSLPSSVMGRISKMKLGEIAGEVIFAGIEGPTLTEGERDVLREVAPGGFVLFRKNLVTLEGARSLCDDLTALMESKKGTRPFIATDQEGGAVTRLPPEATQFPSMMSVGASQRPMNAFKVATLMATELRAVGINMDFAPVVDINNNPDNPVIGTRSFWEDEKTVEQFSTKFIGGMRQGRVLSVAKHFPGHGDTDVDSHRDLPVMKHDIKRLESVELVPFRRAISSGVDGIMVSHVALTRLDPEPTPASLSKNVVTGMLRRKLSFPGLIMTDSLTMRAVADRFEVTEAAIKALEAGNDIVLTCGGVKMAQEVHSALVAKARSDRMFAKKLRRRAARVIANKESKLRNFRKPSLSIVGCNSHVSEILRIVEGSVATVYDDGIVPIHERLRIAGFAAVNDRGLEDVIKEELQAVFQPSQLISYEEIAVGRSPTLGRARVADVCLVFTRDLHNNPGLVEAVNRIIGLKRRTVVIATNNPHDLRRIRRPAAYIVTYSPGRLSIRVAMRTISGDGRPSGAVLPSLRETAEVRSAAK